MIECTHHAWAVHGMHDLSTELSRAILNSLSLALSSLSRFFSLYRYMGKLSLSLSLSLSLFLYSYLSRESSPLSLYIYIYMMYIGRAPRAFILINKVHHEP